MTALLGGHVDAVPVSLGVLVPELQAGPDTRGGPVGTEAHRGTLRRGADVARAGRRLGVSVWRGAFGARGLTPAQVAYWEGIFQRLIASAEWQSYVESVYAVSEFSTSAKTREFAALDHAAEKTFLTELGLAKKQ